jgi:hyaluronoglucosaminidase
VARAFRWRGVVEGFYGTPWSHDARLELLTFLGARDMNAYVYAPKDDAKHRARWREPYDAAEMKRFEELAAHAAGAGIRFGFAISPGLDIDYGSAGDRAALSAKLRPLLDGGVPWFCLLLDDIPMQSGLAPRQGDLATWLLDALRAERPDAALTLCPTEYVGTRPSEYLHALGAALPADVDVMWTGPTVCSPTITVDDAREWADALGGRPPLLWDNYPVNDGTMGASLHLGPYQGRAPDLAGVVGGVLCNPMEYAHASKIALATAAAFLRDPDAYDPDDAWVEAINDVGGDRAPMLTVLAHACADSALRAPDALILHQALELLEDEMPFPGWIDDLAVVAAIFRATKSLPEVFPADGDPLARDVAPWVAAAQREAEAGLAALRVMQAVRPVAVIDGAGRGRAAAVDAERAMQLVFMMMFQWSAARANAKSVFGPRFALYPAVVQLADGSQGVDPALAVREDANAVDRCCRLALAVYDAWRTAPGGDLRVLVDGEERPVAADGTFDGRGTLTLVRAGEWCTRLDHPLPFNEPRLAEER